MSVPVGTLSPAYRADLLAFYSALFGWRELLNLSTGGRLTIAIGPNTYINIREHERPMQAGAYEHFGVLVRSADEVHRLRAEAEALGATPGAIEEAEGLPMFRLQHLLPMAIEVQFIPSS